MARVDLIAFSLDVSSGWTLSSMILAGPKQDEAADPRLLTARPSRSFQQNFVATLEEVSAEETAESYVLRQRAGLHEAGIAFLESVPPEIVELAGGHEGILTEHVIVGPSGERVRQLQLVCIKKGVAHTLITSHLDGDPFERARGDFRKMLLSFA